MKSSAMSADGDRRLIALVRNYPALYNTEDQQYQDTAYKISVWKKISKELGMDAKLCRSRWFNIRDNYRKSIIRNRLKQSAGQSQRVYKYSRDIAFLRDFFSNLEVPQEARPDPLSDANEGGDDDSSEPVVSKRERSESPPPFLELGVPAPAHEFASHPVDAFLACIEPTLKALPPYFLSLAKGEIFATVQKYELRMLRPAEGLVSGSDPHSPPFDN